MLLLLASRPIWERRCYIMMIKRGVPDGMAWDVVYGCFIDHFSFVTWRV